MTTTSTTLHEANALPHTLSSEQTTSCTRRYTRYEDLRRRDADNTDTDEFKVYYEQLAAYVKEHGPLKF